MHTWLHPEAPDWGFGPVCIGANHGHARRCACKGGGVFKLHSAYHGFALSHGPASPGTMLINV
eukprot:5112164-Pyramimonas_sp.AAC.2